MGNDLEVKGIEELLADGSKQISLLRRIPSRQYRRSNAAVHNAPPEVEGYRQFVAESFATPPDLVMVTLYDATIVGSGIVVVGNKYILRESLINVHGDHFAGLRRLSESKFEYHPDDLPCENLQGSPVLIKQTWDENYGHWLIESFPRAYWWQTIFGGGPEFNFIVQDTGNERMNGVTAESLGHIGITGENVVRTMNSKVYRAERLGYISPITLQPWTKSGLVFQAIEHIKREILKTGPTVEVGPKIYVARRDTLRRNLVNAQEILSILEREGYVAVHMEDYELKEQVSIFSEATQIVGILGGALSNLAFANPATKLLALAPPHMFDDFFWDLASHVGVEYHCIHGTTTDLTPSMQSDFEIPPALFSSVFDAWK